MPWAEVEIAVIEKPRIAKHALITYKKFTAKHVTGKKNNMPDKENSFTKEETNQGRSSACKCCIMPFSIILSARRIMFLKAFALDIP